MLEHPTASVIINNYNYGRFIMVDEGRFGGRFALADRAIPFPERGGAYGGRPPTDQAAIRELERLRSRGSRFLVFAWPAFSWLEAYPTFGRYVADRFPCALRDDLRASRRSSRG